MDSKESKRKRVCFLNMPIEFYTPISGGAISTIIAEVAHGLEARGHEVTVLTRVNDQVPYPHGRVVRLGPCGREDLSFLQRRLSGLRWRFAAWDWPYFDYYRSAVCRAAKQLDVVPDVVVAFNDLLSPIYLAKLFPGAKIFVWLQNEQRSRRRDLTAAMAATTRWLTCSGYIRDWTLAHHPFDPAKVSVVPSGVNLEQFQPNSSEDHSGSKLRVLFVGRIDPNKGPDIVVDAVAALRGEGLPVSMTVVGAKWFYKRGDEEVDAYACSLREKMKLAGATDLGHVPRGEIAVVFRQHDVVCVLSRSNEPFGLVVLEAMASGCAVIASNRGGLPEACGGAAELVDPDDAMAVQSVLRRYLADHAALREAKQRALQRGRLAPWEATTECFESLVAASDFIVDRIGSRS